MANHRLYDNFEARLGEAVSASDTDFVNAILGEAEDEVKDITRRDTVPERLDSEVVLLAIIKYNRRGAEGEGSRGEGGISRAFDDLPISSQKRIESYRKVGVVK